MIELQIAETMEAILKAVVLFAAMIEYALVWRQWRERVLKERRGGGGFGWYGRRLLLLTMRPEEKKLIRNGERGKR
jgi:hypothetical protein